MLKCSDIMYCFEMDGTLVNNIHNSTSFLVRNYDILKTKFCFKPSDYDIRWTIVTCRPNLDKPLIYLSCFKNGLAPSEVICCSGNVFYKKDFNFVLYNKLNIFKNILDKKRKVKYTKNAVSKIIHVCNNLSENDFLNANKDGYPIISVNTMDFKREFFNEIV